MAKIVPEKIIRLSWECPHNYKSGYIYVCDLGVNKVCGKTNIPICCPLQNAPEPKDYGDEDNMSYAEFIKRKGGKK